MSYGYLGQIKIKLIIIIIVQAYEMRCAIWYHFHNLKSVKNTLNFGNGTKSRNASHVLQNCNCQNTYKTVIVHVHRFFEEINVR